MKNMRENLNMNANIDGNNDTDHNHYDDDEGFNDYDNDNNDQDNNDNDNDNHANGSLAVGKKTPVVGEGASVGEARRVLDSNVRVSKGAEEESGKDEDESSLHG